MIIQVVGNNGAGKTWVVRRVLEMVLNSWPRTEPLPGQVVDLLGVEAEVYVPGRYGEAGTAGCDTIKDAAAVYQHVYLVGGAKANGRQTANVLFEGIRMMNHTRGVELAVKLRRAEVPFHVVELTTTLAECLARINARRQTSKVTRGPLAMKDLAGNVTRARNYCRKVRDAGALLHKSSSGEAPALVLTLLQGVNL